MKSGIAHTCAHGVALQPDGKIVVAGDFSQVFGNSIHFLTRLNADGTLDATFTTPAATATWGILPSVALQNNGKIILAKFVGTVRLNGDGSIDGTYDTTTTPDWGVNEVVVTPDDEIWEAGGISSENGGPTMGIARLRGDITSFTGWQAANFSRQATEDQTVGGLTGVMDLAPLEGTGQPVLRKRGECVSLLRGPADPAAEERCRLGAVSDGKRHERFQCASDVSTLFSAPALTDICHMPTRGAAGRCCILPADLTGVSHLISLLEPK